MQTDDINDTSLLIEDVIDLSNLAFIRNNDSFINNTYNVLNTVQKLGLGNLNYNSASLVAQIFNNNKGEEEWV